MVLRNLMVALFLLILTTMSALSHSWYDIDCCSKNDCSRITSHQLKGSILTFKTELFKDEVFSVDMSKMPSHRIRPSQDTHTHACVVKGQAHPDGYFVRCLYVGGGS